MLLDPLDLLRMALREGMGHADVLDTPGHDNNFRALVGYYELDALSPLSYATGVSDTGALVLGSSLRVGPGLTLPLRARAGTAPVLYLRARAVGEGVRVCGFAVPAGPGASAPPAVHTPASQRVALAHGRVACSLGPGAMPYACALYPLGSFVETPRSHFFSVDNRDSCEGVGAVPKKLAPEDGFSAHAQGPPSQQTLASYAFNNSLEARADSARWFQRLATAWACSGIEARAAAAAPASAAATLSRLREASASVPLWLVDALQSAAAAAAAAAPLAPVGRRRAAASEPPPPPLLVALRARVRSVWYRPCAALRHAGCNDCGSETLLRSAVEEATAKLHSEVEALFDALAAASA